MVFPTTAAYPDLKFNGRDTTTHLKNISRIFKAHGLTEEDIIRELPYWSSNETLGERIGTAVGDYGTWAEVIIAFKKAFRIRDSKQGRSLIDQIRDLKRGPLLDDA